MSEVGNETFTPQHLPLPDDEEDGESVEDSSTLTATTQSSVADSPPSLPQPPQSRLLKPTAGKEKSKIKDPLEPLVDSRNVYLTRGSRRLR